MISLCQNVEHARSSFGPEEHCYIVRMAGKMPIAILQHRLVGLAVTGLEAGSQVNAQQLGICMDVRVRLQQKRTRIKVPPHASD